MDAICHPLGPHLITNIGGCNHHLQLPVVTTIDGGPQYLQDFIKRGQKKEDSCYGTILTSHQRAWTGSKRNPCKDSIESTCTCMQIQYWMWFTFSWEPMILQCMIDLNSNFIQRSWKDLGIQRELWCAANHTAWHLPLVTCCRFSTKGIFIALLSFDL